MKSEAEIMVTPKQFLKNVVYPVCLTGEESDDNNINVEKKF